MPGWDRESGQLVIVSHFFLVEDMPHPLVGLSAQIDICAQMAATMQKTHLGKRDDTATAPGDKEAGHKEADKPIASSKSLSTSVAMALAMRQRKTH